MTIGGDSRSSRGGGQAEDAARLIERDHLFRSVPSLIPCEEAVSADRLYSSPRSYASAASSIGIPSPLCHSSPRRAACCSPRLLETPHVLTEAFSLQQQQHHEQPLRQIMPRPPPQPKLDAQQPQAFSRGEQQESQHQDPPYLSHRRLQVHLQEQRSPQQQQHLSIQQQALSVPCAPVYRPQSSPSVFRELRQQHLHQRGQQMLQEQRQRERRCIHRCESAVTAADQSVVKACNVNEQYTSCLSASVRFSTSSSAVTAGESQQQRQQGNGTQVGARDMRSRRATIEIPATRPPRSVTPCDLVVPRMIFSHHRLPKGTSSRYFSGPACASVSSAASPGAADSAVAVAAALHQSVVSAAAPGVCPHKSVGSRATAAADGWFPRGTSPSSTATVSAAVASPRGPVSPSTADHRYNSASSSYAVVSSARMPSFISLHADTACGESMHSRLLSGSAAEASAGQAGTAAAAERGLECTGHRPQQQPVASSFPTCSSAAPGEPCMTVVTPQWRTAADFPAVVRPPPLPAAPAGRRGSAAAAEPSWVRDRAAVPVSCDVVGVTLRCTAECAAAGDQTGPRRGMPRPLAGTATSAAGAAASSNGGRNERGDHISAAAEDTALKEELVYFPADSTIASPSTGATSAGSFCASDRFGASLAPADIAASRTGVPSAAGAAPPEEVDSVDASRNSGAAEPPSRQCPPAVACAGAVKAVACHSGHVAAAERSCWIGCGSVAVEAALSPASAMLAGVAAADAPLPAAAAEVADADAGPDMPANNGNFERSCDSQVLPAERSKGSNDVRSSITKGTTSNESCCSSRVSGVGNVSSEETGTSLVTDNSAYLCDGDSAATGGLDACASAAAAAQRRHAVTPFLFKFHDEVDGITFKNALIDSVLPAPSSTDATPTRLDTTATAATSAEAYHATELAHPAAAAAVMVRATAKKTAPATAKQGGALLQPSSSSAEGSVEDSSGFSGTVSVGGSLRCFISGSAGRGNSSYRHVDRSNSDELVHRTASTGLQHRDTDVTADKSASSEETPASWISSSVFFSPGTAPGTEASSLTLSTTPSSAAPPPRCRTPEESATTFIRKVSTANRAAAASSVTPAQDAAAAFGSFSTLTALGDLYSRATAQKLQQTAVDPSAASAATAYTDSEDSRPAAIVRARVAVSRKTAAEGVKTCPSEVVQGLGHEAAAEIGIQETAARTPSQKIEEALAAPAGRTEEAALCATAVATAASTRAPSKAEATAMSRPPAISLPAGKAATVTATSFERETAISGHLGRNLLSDLATDGVATAGTSGEAACRKSPRTSAYVAASQSSAAAAGRSPAAPPMVAGKNATTVAASSYLPPGVLLKEDVTRPLMSPRSAGPPVSSSDKTTIPLCIPSAADTPLTLCETSMGRSAAPSSLLTNILHRSAAPGHSFRDGAAAAAGALQPTAHHQQQDGYWRRRAAAFVEGTEDAYPGAGCLLSPLKFWKEKRSDPFLVSPTDIAAVASSAVLGAAAEDKFFSGAATTQGLLCVLPTPSLAGTGAPAATVAAVSPPSLVAKRTAAYPCVSTAQRCPAATPRSSALSSFSCLSGCGALADSCVSPQAEPDFGPAVLPHMSSCAAPRALHRVRLSHAKSGIGSASPFSAAISDGAAAGEGIIAGAVPFDASTADPRGVAAAADFAVYSSASPAAECEATGSSGAAEQLGMPTGADALSRDVIAGEYRCLRPAATALGVSDMSRGSAPSPPPAVMLSPPSMSPSSSLLLKAVSLQRKSASSPASPVSHPVSDPELGEQVFVPLLQQQQLFHQQLLQQQLLFQQQQLFKQQQLVEQQPSLPRPLHAQQQRRQAQWQLLPSPVPDAAIPMLASPKSPRAAAAVPRSHSAVLAAAATAIAAAAAGDAAAACSRKFLPGSKCVTGSRHGLTTNSHCRAVGGSSGNRSNDVTTNINGAGDHESFTLHNNEDMSRMNHSHGNSVFFSVDDAADSRKSDSRSRRSTSRCTGVVGNTSRNSNSPNNSSEETSHASCVSSFSESNTRSSSRSSPRSSSCGGPQSNSSHNGNEMNSKSETGFDAKHLHAAEVKSCDVFPEAAKEACLPTNDSPSPAPVSMSSHYQAAAAAAPTSRTPAPPATANPQGNGNETVPGATSAAKKRNLFAVDGSRQRHGPVAAAEAQERDVFTAAAAASVPVGVECRASHRWAEFFDQRRGEASFVAAVSSEVCNRTVAATSSSVEETPAGRESSTDEGAAHAAAPAAANASVADLCRTLEASVAAASGEMEREAAAAGAFSGRDAGRRTIEKSAETVDDDVRSQVTAAAATLSQTATGGVATDREAAAPFYSGIVVNADTVLATRQERGELGNESKEKPPEAVAEAEASSQSAGAPANIVILLEAAASPARRQRRACATRLENSSTDADKKWISSNSSDLRIPCDTSSTRSSIRSRRCSPSHPAASWYCMETGNSVQGEAMATGNFEEIECRKESGAALPAATALATPANNTRTTAPGARGGDTAAREETSPCPFANVSLKYAADTTRIVAAALPGAGNADEGCYCSSSIYAEKSSRYPRRAGAGVAVCVSSAAETGTGAVASLSATPAPAEPDVESEEDNPRGERFFPRWQQGMLSQVAAAPDVFTPAPTPPADTNRTSLSAQATGGSGAAAAVSGAALAAVSGIEVAVASGAALLVRREAAPVATSARSRGGPTVPAVTAGRDGGVAGGHGDHCAGRAAPNTVAYGSGESVHYLAADDNGVVVGATGDGDDENRSRGAGTAGTGSEWVADAAPMGGRSATAGGREGTAAGTGPAADTTETLSGRGTDWKENQQQEKMGKEEVGNVKREETEENEEEVRTENRGITESFSAMSQQPREAQQEDEGKTDPEQPEKEQLEKERVQQHGELPDQQTRRVFEKPKKEETEVETPAGGGMQQEQEGVLHSQEHRDGVEVCDSQQECMTGEPAQQQEQQSIAESLEMQQHQPDEVSQRGQQPGSTTEVEKNINSNSREAVAPLREQVSEKSSTAAVFGDTGEEATGHVPDAGFRTPLDQLTVSFRREIEGQAAAADGGTAQTSEEQGVGVAVEVTALRMDEYIRQEGRPQQLQHRQLERVGSALLQATDAGTVFGFQPSNNVTALADAAGGLEAMHGPPATETERKEGVHGSGEAADGVAAAVETSETAAASCTERDREESGFLVRAAVPGAVTGETADSRCAAVEATPAIAGGRGESPATGGGTPAKVPAAAAETPAAIGTAAATVGAADGGAFAEEEAYTVPQGTAVAEQGRIQDVGAEEAPEEGAFMRVKMPNDNFSGESHSGRGHRADAHFDTPARITARRTRGPGGGTTARRRKRRTVHPRGTDEVLFVSTEGDSRQEYLAIYERESNQVWYNRNVFNSVQMWVRWLEARETHAFLLQHAEGDESASFCSSSLSSLSGDDDSDSDSDSDSDGDSDADSDSDSDSEEDPSENLQSPTEHRLRAVPIGTSVTTTRELRTGGMVRTAAATGGVCHVSRIHQQQQQHQRLQQPQHHLRAFSTDFLPNGIPNPDAAGD